MSNELERRIDWIARQLRSEVRENSSDIRLADELVKFAATIDVTCTIEEAENLMSYFIQSLKREFQEPDLVLPWRIDYSPVEVDAD